MLVPIGLLAGLGVIVRQSQTDLMTSGNWVSHTLEVEAGLARLQALVTDAVAAERGYLLTRRADYLVPFDTAMGRIPRQEMELVSLTADNFSQQRRLKGLHEVIATRMTRQGEMVSLARNGRWDEALAISAKGDHPISEIRKGIEEAMVEERALLHTRQAVLAGKSALHTDASILLISFAAGTVGAALWMLRRMQRVEALVTVCAWSKTVELDGEWLTFEEYLQKRFGFGISHGISPEEAVKFREEMEAQQGRRQREREQQRKAAA